METDKKTALVLVPHGDDETLGMGGTINKLVIEGYYVYCGLFIYPDSYETERNEFENACKELGAIPLLFDIGENGSLNVIPMKDAVTKLDNWIQSWKPEYVFIPAPCVHQDHRYVYEVGMASCRTGTSDNFYSPKKVLLYNPMLYFDSQFFTDGHNTVFFELNLGNVVAKKKAIEKYICKSSKPPKAVNPETVELYSKSVGTEIGVHFAEKFIPIRIMM